MGRKKTPRGGAARPPTGRIACLDTGLRRRNRPRVPLVLDLLRHGHALPAAEGGDEPRRLSERGRADIRRLATRLRDMGWRPEHAFTSPLPRARESAVIALEVAVPGLAPALLEALRPESAPEETLAAVAETGVATGHVLLVGHQPLLGMLAGLLTAGAPPALATGSLVRIEFGGRPRAGAGVQTWSLAP